MSAVVDAELSGLTKILGPLAKRQVKILLRQWMEGLARYVEAK